MNTTIKVIPYSDELMDRYNELAMMNVIPSMAEYAYQWQLLATQAEGKNRPALAAHARAHAEHYAQFEPGEYIKLVEGSLSEMLPIG